MLPRITWLLRRVLTPNVHTAQESGAALARLVIDPVLADVTGQDFDGPNPIPSSEESYDPRRADELRQSGLRLIAT